MKKILTLLFTMLLLTPAFCSSGKDDKVFYVDASVESFCGVSDGSVFMLTSNNEIIHMEPDGEAKIYKVPAPKEKLKGQEFYFTGMSANVGKVYLCTFEKPCIYTLYLRAPKRLSVTNLKSPEPVKTVQPMSVSVRNGIMTMMDSNNEVYRVSRNGMLSKFEGTPLLELSASGEPVYVSPAFDDSGERIRPSVLSEGKTVWLPPLLDSGKTGPDSMMPSKVDYLGFDRTGRDVFLVVYSAGELSSRPVLFSVKNGKVTGSRSIPSSNMPYVDGYCRLSDDGSILLLMKDLRNGHGVILKKMFLRDEHIKSEG